MDRDLLKAKELALMVKEKGGKAYFVGGYVRDKLLNIENKDIDIEIHAIEPHVLEGILEILGGKMSFGESFGIYGIKGYGIDIAMPRKEKQRGTGHKDFEVTVDPFIGTENASRRRDFTVNALLEDVLTGEITDHFGGVDDLRKKVLRHIKDETFIEDPLRVLRAAQFASRFDFKIAEETVLLCKTMDINSLSRERIFLETEKALLKAEKPSKYFEILREMGKLSYWFSELYDLIGVKQNPRHHGEGDVWVHTMMVLDAAAKYRDKVENKLWFMLSALTHDFGKAIATEEIDGVIHSYGHEVKGLHLVKGFLNRITGENKLTDYVLNMVKNHMRPNTLAGANSSLKATNKMFYESLDPQALIYLGLSDGEGRIKEGADESKNGEFLFERLSIYNEIMAEPYVTGRDLIEAGLKPDENFSELLNFACKLRLSGTKKESALKQTLSLANKLTKKNKKK